MTLANRSTDSHLPRRTTPRHSTPRRTTPRHSTPRHAAPRRITPRHNSIPLCSRGDVGVGPSLHELCTSLGGSGAQYLKQQLQEESSTGQRWYVTSNEGTTLLTTFTGGDLEARHAKAAAGATDTKRADRIFNAIEAPCPALSKSPIRFERTFFYADGSANVAHADAVESYIAKTHQPKLVEVRESRIVAHQFIRRNWQVQNNTRSTDRPTNQPTNHNHNNYGSFASHFYMGLLSGVKYWRIWPASETPLLYPTAPMEGSRDLVFASDPLNPDLKLHPAAALTHPWEHVLEAGDIIFVPSECPHFVKVKLVPHPLHDHQN